MERGQLLCIPVSQMSCGEKLCSVTHGLPPHAILHDDLPPHAVLHDACLHMLSSMKTCLHMLTAICLIIGSEATGPTY